MILYQNFIKSMKFYIPHIESSKEAEDLFECVKKFATKQTSWQVSDRRIRSIKYNHDGKGFIAEVGKRKVVQEKKYS